MKRMVLTCGIVALVAAPSMAAAQKCEINDRSPFQLNSARIYLSKALPSTGGKIDERPKHLRNAVAVLTDKAERISNPVGRAYMLGRALYQWLQDGNSGLVSTRANIGYVDRPNDPVDMLAAMDSAFGVVEAGAPACKDSIAKFRRQVGVNIVNNAVTALNAGSLDSAAGLLVHASKIMPGYPYIYNTMANIAEKRGQQDTVVYYYARVIESTKGDTSAAIVRMRNIALYNMAIARLNAGERAQGTERQRLLGEAKTLLDEYMTLNPDNANAQRVLARIAVATGDTATATNVYAGMLEDPSKYSESQLFEAASALAIAKKNDDAIKLFQAALASNPFYRDALYNLASTHYQANNYTEMLPVAQRLVAVDPGSPESWQQMAAAYQGLYRSEKNAAKKKVYLDSLLKYTAKSKNAPMRISFSTFKHEGPKHTLQGRLENLGTAPANVTLKFEFVDKAGAVVATKDVAVGPVAPKGQAPFTVIVEQAGIVGFRYAPPF